MILSALSVVIFHSLRQNIVSQQYMQQRNSDNIANRRIMNYNNAAERFTVRLHNLPTKGESLREYVPDQGIGDPLKWFLPKLPPNIQKDFISQDNDPNLPPTFPPPVTPRRGPLTPIRGRIRMTTESTTTKKAMPKIDFMEMFSTDPYIPEFDPPSDGDTTSHLNYNYDEEIRGYPVRRKRSDQSVNRFPSNTVVLHDPAINKTSKEINNQNGNIYNKVTTVFEYVTKTIRAKAFKNDTVQKALQSGLKSLLRPQ